MLTQVQADKLKCYHCGLPVAAGDSYFAELGGERRPFCCPSCRLVASTIHESGLGGFYQHYDQSGLAVDEALVGETYSSFDNPEFQHRYVTSRVSGGKVVASVELLIGGIHCAACVWLLEKYLTAIPSVTQVSINLNEQVARISWHSEELSLSAICRAIASLGYEPQFYSADQLAQLQERENHLALRRLGVAGLAMMQVGMFAVALYAGALQGIDPAIRDYLRWISLLVATPVVFYSARPFFTGAWRGLRTRAPGMDLPVAIAIGLAYGASLHATVSASGEVYFDSVAMFTFLLLAGRYLEMRARHLGARVNSDLNSLLPSSVTRVTAREGKQCRETVPLFNVEVGDRVLVKAGQVIPVDGVVVSGQGSVNEAQLTGEFIPLYKGPGDAVVAGTINETGVLTIEAESVGQQLKLQTINVLLAKARSNKPRIAQLADRYAGRFVLAVLGVAVATFGYWYFSGGDAEQAFRITLSVLVVSCPCALSLATPAAMTAATNQLRRLGLLVTNPEVWEKAGTITDVVCDKTGTLTRGELSVSAVLPIAALSSQRCLQLAAAIERHSGHPIAKAFDQVVADDRVEAVQIKEGSGIEAVVDGRRYRIGKPSYVRELFDRPLESPHSDGHWILLAGETGPVCWFQLQDRLRDDAGDCIAELKRRHLRLHLLSGDSSGAAEQLARQLRFDECLAGATPEQKLVYVNALQSRGRRVLMLGDGLNDIPVLAAADISVAMANASNLAKTQADTIALSGQLQSVGQLLELARRTRTVVRENLGWALVYNLAAIPLAAVGLVPPYLAALGMSLSSLIVVGNALRLQRQQPRSLGTSGALTSGGGFG